MSDRKITKQEGGNLNVYLAAKYVLRCTEDLYTSEYKARDAADLLGYIRGLNASGAVEYEVLYILLLILTEACVRIITSEDYKNRGEMNDLF